MGLRRMEFISMSYSMLPPAKADHLTGNDDEFLPTFLFFHGHFHMLENTEY